MHHDDDMIWAAIERVLAGDATADDELLVSRWTREDPANEAELRRLEAAWQIASSSGRTFDSSAAWSKVQSGIGEAAAGSAIGAAAATPPAGTPVTVTPIGEAGSRRAAGRPRRSFRPTSLMWAAMLALVL